MSIEAMKQALEALEKYPVTVNHWKTVLLPVAEVLRQAIAEAEQLDKLLVHQPMLDLWQRYCDKKQEVDDLKEKLAEAEKQDHEWVCGECIKCGASIEKQKPAAWRWRMSLVQDRYWQYSEHPHQDALVKEPLYDHPQPKREPLTDEGVLELWRKHQDVRAFARAIEAAHGIKE